VNTGEKFNGLFHLKLATNLQPTCNQLGSKYKVPKPDTGEIVCEWHLVGKLKSIANLCTIFQKNC